MNDVQECNISPKIHARTITKIIGPKVSVNPIAIIYLSRRYEIPCLKITHIWICWCKTASVVGSVSWCCNQCLLVTSAQRSSTSALHSRTFPCMKSIQLVHCGIDMKMTLFFLAVLFGQRFSFSIEWLSYISNCI